MDLNPLVSQKHFHALYQQQYWVLNCKPEKKSSNKSIIYSVDPRGSTIGYPRWRWLTSKNRRTVQLLNNVGGDEPVGADANIAADEVLSKPNGKILAVIGANQIERDVLVGQLANTHPELTAIAYATVSECVGFSADPDVIMLRVSQDTSAQMALQDIEQLRSAFPDVPVMVITKD